VRQSGHGCDDGGSGNCFYALATAALFSCNTSATAAEAHCDCGKRQQANEDKIVRHETLEPQRLPFSAADLKAHQASSHLSWEAHELTNRTVAHSGDKVTSVFDQKTGVKTGMLISHPDYSAELRDHMVYDNCGRLVSEQFERTDGVSGEYRYNVETNRLASATMHKLDGTAVRIDYRQEGNGVPQTVRTVHPDGSASLVQFGPDGRPQSVTLSRAGRVDFFRADANGKMHRVEKASTH